VKPRKKSAPPKVEPKVTERLLSKKVTVKLHPVFPPMGEQEVFGDEPTWFDVIVTKETYSKELMRGLNWHSYCADKKDHRLYITEWIKAFRPQTAKADLALWDSVPDKYIEAARPNMARVQLQGFPLSATDEAKIWDWVTAAKGRAKDARDPKDDKPRLTVQDHIRKQVVVTLSDIDALVDDAFDGKKINTKNAVNAILKKEYKPHQMKMVFEHIRHYHIEWAEALRVKTSAKTEDEKCLAEGYSFITKAALQKIVATFEEIATCIAPMAVVPRKPRRKKPVDKKKLVAKLRFKTNLGGITSIKPVEIIGASVLWTYDTAKRKLCYYEGGLSVKGTTIIGAKVAEQKVLRRPKEQLAEFQKLRKNHYDWFRSHQS
jgi:hypothetical protein